MKYVVIEEDNGNSFERTVNHYAEKGYVLIERTVSRGETFFCMMVKYFSEN